MNGIISSNINGKNETGIFALGDLKFFYKKMPIQDRWLNLTGYESSRWWFEQVPIDELAEIIIGSLNTRNRDRADGKISVHDRGWRMFKAVCAATKMVRENVALTEAAE
jgi:hypothetical protein